MTISSVDFIPGKEVVEVLDIARGSTVRARHVGRDFTAVFKALPVERSPNIPNSWPEPGNKPLKE
jgi:uncharacterized protein YbjQ (UPF0145 family)